MLHPSAHRHLRQYTGLAALDALKASQEAAEVPAEPAVTDTAEATIPSPASEQKPRGRPTGGHLRVTVSATGVVENDLDQGGPRVPDLSICVQGKNLHAPLIERIIELPMDIDAGRVDGELIIQCKDVESWDFPQFHGRVVVRGAAFHFWDATDDILDADLDLLFESDRVYLHRAKGRFGAVPMTVTGDLDLDPLTGEYRLSAKVPGVEANMLRATLGVRPMPFPVAGAVMGTLHVTGPLEKPVFSGRFTANRTYFISIFIS